MSNAAGKAVRSRNKIELSRTDRMPEWKSSLKVKQVIRFRVTLIRSQFPVL
jgi:hypothetical protein